jgi:hypothetical protein
MLTDKILFFFFHSPRLLSTESTNVVCQHWHLFVLVNKWCDDCEQCHKQLCSLLPCLQLMVADETIKFKGSIIQFQLYLNNIITVFWHFYVGVTEETRPPSSPDQLSNSFKPQLLLSSSGKVWMFLFIFDFRFFNLFVINLKKKVCSVSL